MKNFYVLFVLLISFHFLSCESSEISNEENFINLTKIENIKAMDDSSQRIAFRLLSSKEKHKFRASFINDFIDRNDLSESQIKLIEDLKVNFTVDVYNNSDKAEYFKNVYIQDWLIKAKQHFSIKEIYTMVAAPYSQKNTSKNTNNKQQRRGIGDDCSCHQGGTFWCTTQRETNYSLTDPSVTTTSVPCNSSNGCQVPGSINDNGEWEEDSGGCGWFWLQRCDGGC